MKLGGHSNPAVGRVKIVLTLLASALALCSAGSLANTNPKEPKNESGGPKIVIEKMNQYTKANAENLGKAIGISYGTHIIVEYLHTNCVTWFPNDQKDLDSAYARWKEKNGKHSKQAKRVVDDLVQMTSSSKNSKAVKANQRFAGLRNRYVAMMSRDLDKMPAAARKKTCARLVTQINEGTLDVERRGVNVQKLLYGWNQDAFKEYMKKQGSL